ncbi:hypothetical protein BDQ12DRAFT_686803 [Crucibulum laeve]|uniref:Uncharacterized protein n=1 Tax=Crucibulum laeve TaxID=68775 RepID=A0A5C3LW94_9AGAR|nr:hypothetical protein BDQ12DRAFT_686803 [Crucibulum laeve]
MHTMDDSSSVEARRDRIFEALDASKISRLFAISRFDAVGKQNSKDKHKPDIVSKSNSILPEEVAEAYPWMEKLASSSKEKMDKYLAETWKHRKVFRQKDNLEAIVDLMQQQKWKEPLNRATWRLVILDEYVDFEKLHATLDSGYPYETRSINTKREWERVFCAWEKGMTAVYPHRTIEIWQYRSMMVDVFNIVGDNYLVAIKFDAARRYLYSRSPFRLDHRQDFRWAFVLMVLNVAAERDDAMTDVSEGFSAQDV